MLVVAFFFKLHEFFSTQYKKLRVQLPPPTNVEVA